MILNESNTLSFNMIEIKLTFFSTSIILFEESGKTTIFSMQDFRKVYIKLLELQ